MPLDTTFNAGQIFSTHHDNLEKMPGGPLQQLSKTSSEISKHLNITSFKTAVKLLQTIKVQYECEGWFSS